MSDTNFINNVTLTDADWFNDLNRLHYTILGDPADADAARASLGFSGTGGTVATANLEDGAVTATKVATGFVVDRVIGTYATSADITTVVPVDDTIPQNTEGVQIISVTITPKSSTSRLRARFNGNVASSAGAGNAVICGLFCTPGPGGSDAIAARAISVPVTGYVFGIALEHEWVPGSTNQQTVTVRIGPNTGTIRLNGGTAARQLGGAQAATLIVEEIKA